MTVLHTGTTKRYAAGWEAIFSGKKSASGSSRSTKKPAKKSPAKKKSTGKK